MCLRSVRIESVKIVRNVMCGMMSSEGTDIGNLSSVGSRTVKSGMDRSRLDVWSSNSVRASFVLSMVIRDVRNKVHSMMMLFRLVIFIPTPYQWTVKGHSSCVGPVR